MQLHVYLSNRHEPLKERLTSNVPRDVDYCRIPGVACYHTIINVPLVGLP